MKKNVFSLSSTHDLKARFALASTLVLAVTLCFASPALAKKTVKVGFIAPLSGGVSANGLGGRNSAGLAVKLRNENAASQYHYELETLDDECKPNIGVQVATKLAADRKVVGVVAHYCSAVALGTVDIYHRFGIPAIVWGAVHPDITYGNDYGEVFRVNGTMINQNETAASFVKGLGYKKWAIIHDTTDYGKGHNKYFSQFLKESGGEIVGTFGVTSDQQDFTAELTKIKALSPDVVYFGGLTPIGVRIRAQMEKIGLDALFQGTSGIVSEAFIEGAGALAEGTLAFREGAPIEKLPGGVFFIEKYDESTFSQPPEAYGPFAFAAMDLLLDTIEKVGPDRKKVSKALQATDGYDSIVGNISFDDHGQNTVAMITKYVVQDGKWIVWEDSEYVTGTRKLNGQ